MGSASTAVALSSCGLGGRDPGAGTPARARVPAPEPFLRALGPPRRLYGDEPVLPELASVAAAAFAADGVPAARVAVVSGALDRIERVLAAQLAPGDALAVEDPGWPGVLDLARTLGLRLHGVAVDARGMRPDALA